MLRNVRPTLVWVAVISTAVVAYGAVLEQVSA
jgi:hypothetical protein